MNRNRSRRKLAYDPYVTLAAYIFPTTKIINWFSDTYDSDIQRWKEGQ